MFSRRERLPTPRLPATAWTIQFPYFTIRVTQNNKSHNRYAIIVGTAVDRRATIRNLLRRRCRAVLRAWPGGSADVVVTLKRASATAPRRELIAALTTARKAAINH